MSPVEVVADPHAMEPCGCDDMAPEVVATEEYANEPNAQTVDQQTPSDFGLKRNLQKKNDVGNYRGDNHLGESLMAKYQEFKKKELNESVNLPPNKIKELNQSVIDMLNQYFNGKAWFNGGSYSYLMDVKHPTIMKSSDGGTIKIKNFATGILKYADRDVLEDMLSDDGEYISELDYLELYFRPANAVRDQESHELANLRGD